MARSLHHRALVVATLALVMIPVGARAENPAALISTFRTANGERNVTIDPALTTIAKNQADAMAAKAVLEHDVLGDFSKRVAPAKAGRAAENIAYGYDDFPRTLKQWINSPSHRKNLLLKDASKVGIASTKSPIDKRTYWAMVIAGDYEKAPLREKKNSAKSAGADKLTKPKTAAPCRLSVIGLCL